MYCSNCGKETSANDKYCGNCRAPLYKTEPPVEEINTIEYNKPAFWISIISVVCSFLAFAEGVMYVGIALGLISLVMIIYILKQNKKNKVNNSRNLYTLTFSIVGIISNTMWLLFTILVLPYI